MKLKTIKPNKDNPRVIRDAKFAKLKNSIQEFPAMMALRPIVVDETYTVLGGNMRFKALQDLGYTEIPDEWVKKADELTEDEKRRFIVADNVGFGEWDWDVLANDWDAGELQEWGVDVPTFAIQEEAPDTNPFNDNGISGNSQYGVIVICENAGNQESVYTTLTSMGYNCKIVVT